MDQLQDEVLDRIAVRLKAMGNPVRLKILQAIHEGALPVNEILSRVGGSQANVSKHLNVLRSAGLVHGKRAGVSVYYQISDPTVFAICEAVCDSLLDRARAEAELIDQMRSNMQTAGSR